MCQILLKFMHKCRSYDPDKSGRTHASVHNARTYSLAKTAMSRFTASGLDKKEQYSCLYSRANPKSGYICIQFMLLTVIISSVILLVNIIVMSSNTSITSIFMLTLLHQIELEVS